MTINDPARACEPFVNDPQRTLHERLLRAALDFGAAWETYSKAYDAWRDAHPDEEHLPQHNDLPSWQAEVQPACRAVNLANERLRNVSIELHTARRP